jgi:aminoglycoside 2''-phosphotransferase
LHEVDVGVGEAAGLERVDHEARVRARVADADGRMRALPDTLGRALREAFAGWVAENAVRPYRPAILHADLSPEHVLVDPAAGAITGIIDWGDAVVGDPARDFIFLYEDWDLDFLDHAIAGYAPGLAAEAWARLRARVLVHYLADQLDWTLTAHAEGRASDVRHGVDGLERALSALRDRA